MTAAPSYRVLTLGCKLNQFDSAEIEGMLRARGLRSAADADPAGLVVLNTCTVTGLADREARRLARRARRENPGCRLVVTGCYAELDRRRLEEMDEVDAVVGRAERGRLGEIVDGLVPALAAAGPGGTCIETAQGVPPLYFGERSRAFLKIQEGCDLNCSYCIIPRVRGRSRSLEPALLERALARLVAAGYREIVLTGVNTGDYGKDLLPRTTLSALLRRLLALPGLGRLRLNSLEPRTVTPEIVATLAAEPRLARHLQVPLQSGSGRILRAMRRNYRPTDYMRTVETLRREVPEIGLGADVIVGFPGERDEEFDETVRFIESSPLNYLHVFTWSDRPGTPASDLPGRVAPESCRERSARARALGVALSLRFRASFVGRSLPALVLAEGRPGGRRRALTDNFIDLDLDVPAALSGAIVAARIVAAGPSGTFAVAEPSSPLARGA